MVGYCGYAASLSPWERVWLDRNIYESELNDHLRTLPSMPKLDYFSRSLLYATEARSQTRAGERVLEKEGFRLLSSRDRATIKAGRQPPRPVYVTKDGKRHWFRSVRAAARAMGVDPSTITLAAQSSNRPDVTYAP